MKRLLTLWALCASLMVAQAKDYQLASPDGQLTLSVRTGERLTYSVARGGVVLLEPSAIGLHLADGTVWGAGTRFSKAVRRSVNTSCEAPFFKRSTVKDHYNELCLKAKGFELQFRAYDDGVAWRFVPAKPVTVKAEEAVFAFAKDWKAYIPYVNQHTETLESQFFSSQEAQYTHAAISDWNKERMAFPPVTVEADGGVKICITESDLLDYPGLYLYNGDGDRTLEGRFARVPARYAQEDGKTFQRLITARKDVLAENTRELPWRTIIVVPEAKDLAQSDFVWRLASPNALGDLSWLKPGKVAWDWWNGWNLYGVDFEAGINTQTYKYYIDFETIYRNAEEHKLELNMMNSLIGSKNIETDFENLVKKYPEVLKCIPTLLAVRQYEIIVLDSDGNKFEYNFKEMNYDVAQYKVFMKETGLFDLIQNHLVNNLYDYVLGVESGLNSNARKNRGGHLMEDVVERFIQKAGFKKNETYFKEMYLQDIEEKWKLDMSFISNQNQSTKRFDFVVKTDKCIYGIETNFYAAGGSKLNETARSYKMIAEEAEKVVGFEFVWFTDGMGWISARNNLKETFDKMDNIYNIADMKNGVMKEIFK